MRAHPILIIASLVAAAHSAIAQAPAGTGTPSFGYERIVTVDSAGWNRLALDATILAGSTPFRVSARTAGVGTAVATGGLSDLRMYDDAGREVPYLLVRPERREDPRIPARPIPISTKGKDSTSGFEIDLGAARRVDLLQVAGLPAPFLKRLRLEGSGDRARWTLLVAEGTLFDLPHERLTQLELAFLPGDYRYLRLTWDDRFSGRMPRPGDVLVRVAQSPAPPTPPLTVALPFERRPSEPGKSRYMVRLPGAHLPIAALLLTVSDSNVLRVARVTEARLTGDDVTPAVLGSATLRRASLGGLMASALEIPIDAPAESRVELTIDDGDNPPLALSGVSAIFAGLPFILFEARTTVALRARYGAPALAAPRYDLEALRDSALTLRTATARWGDVLRLQPSDAAAATAGLPSGGAPIDITRFRWSRGFRDTTPGLATVRLDAAALAHSRLSDLRIADPSGRQVPYLFEHLDGPLTDSLPAAERLPRADTLVGGGFTSRYRIHLPYDSLPDARMVLRTSARVFRRRIRVEVPYADNTRRSGSMRTIAFAEWAHADPDTPAPPLTLALPRLGRDEAQLVVDDGDNETLPLLAPVLLLPGYELRFLTDGTGGLHLLYGRRDLDTPRYDIALLGPRLVGVSATEAVLEPEGAATAGGTSTMPGRIFWGVLIGAVLILLALIVRLVKHGPPAEPGAKSA